MNTDKPIEKIIAAASLKLGQIYPLIPVYVEQIKQKLQEESFVLYAMPSITRKVSDVRFQTTGFLDIAYIIRDDSDSALLREQFMEKYQTISTSLTNISFGTSRIRLTDFQYQVSDNVLHIISSFTIQYFVEEVSG